MVACKFQPQARLERAQLRDLLRLVPDRRNQAYSLFIIQCSTQLQVYVGHHTYLGAVFILQHPLTGLERLEAAGGAPPQTKT